MAMPGSAATSSTRDVSHNRVLRVRITDVETARIKVGITLPIGLVSVATRLGALLVPGPQAAVVLATIERGELEAPVVIEDDENGERIEIDLL